jgi:thioredoxin reductase (NADPH)
LTGADQRGIHPKARNKGILEAMVDVAIVGAGPVGLAAGIEAKRHGLTSVILEKGAVANSILQFPADTVFFSESKNLEIGGHPLVSAGAKPTRREVLAYYQKVAAREGLKILPFREVVDIQGEENAFLLVTHSRKGEETFAARYVVVATGYFDNPNYLGVPGENLPHVHHRFREAAFYFGCEVTVIGGSNSAVEAALELYRAGAQVTLVHRGKALRPEVKYWLAPDFHNRVREGAIRSFFRTTVQSISVSGLNLKQGRKSFFWPTDFVLVLIGYRASDQLLRKAGVTYEGDRPLLTASFESSRSGLFAIGSCACGGETRGVFIENGREQAAVALATIARRVLGT